MGGNSRKESVVAAFEKALETFESHRRPPGYPGLTAETRRRANIAQFEVFASAYWPMWRYVKIHSYRRLLGQRDDIAIDLGDLFPSDEISAPSRTYQEVTNGLLASAASEFCQYAEDLAALCQALQSDDFFARDLLSFSAGRIQNQLQGWKHINRDKCCKLLCIPVIDKTVQWPIKEVKAEYDSGIERSIELMRSISVIYSNWYYHYMRYKHGLALALAPFANELEESYMDERRQDTRGLPVAFDCGSVSEIVGKQHFQSLLSIPNMGADDVRLNALSLSRERNLLRYVMPPRRDAEPPSIDELEEAAFFIGQLQHVAIRNYYSRQRRARENKSGWICLLPKSRRYIEIRSADAV